MGRSVPSGFCAYEHCGAGCAFLGRHAHRTECSMIVSGSSSCDGSGCSQSLRLASIVTVLAASQSELPVVVVSMARGSHAEISLATCALKWVIGVIVEFVVWQCWLLLGPHGLRYLLRYELGGVVALIGNALNLMPQCSLFALLLE